VSREGGEENRRKKFFSFATIEVFARQKSLSPSPLTSRISFLGWNARGRAGDVAVLASVGAFQVSWVVFLVWKASELTWNTSSLTWKAPLQVSGVTFLTWNTPLLGSSATFLVWNVVVLTRTAPALTWNGLFQVSSVTFHTRNVAFLTRSVAFHTRSVAFLTWNVAFLTWNEALPTWKMSCLETGWSKNKTGHLLTQSGRSPLIRFQCCGIRIRHFLPTPVCNRFIAARWKIPIKIVN
jgi:hypothetical protein